MSKNTPTTDDVRWTYIMGEDGDTGWGARARFNRWLDEYTRGVREEAWDEGALWAAVECNAIKDEHDPWLAPGDNPYTA